ncbi:MAG TPA: GGDEF domain-containing protein [Myxococcales bacterium]|nr:GGDEF domain-containing protein [Myxococcales bacterium]
MSGPDFEDDKTQIRGVVTPLGTATAKSQNAYLIVISGKAVGKMFKLATGEMVIGRSDQAQILLDDDGVSRKHAKVQRGPDGQVRIVDLQSTNGTYCDGVRIDSHVLRDGDKVQIGNATILKFSYQDDLEEAFQRQLYESATKDGLTKIFNKKFFLERLRHEVSYSLRHSLPVTLLIIDVDFFKKVNDTHGHQAGDYVLGRLASVVGETIRGEDVFARYGGEEFALILRECTEEKGLLMGERLRALVAGTDFTWGEVRIPVTISLGVACLSGGNYGSPDDLIAAADGFLYEAKRKGRNRVEGARTQGRR